MTHSLVDEVLILGEGQRMTLGIHDKHPPVHRQNIPNHL